MSQKIVFKDEFLDSRGLYDLSKMEHKKMWREFAKFNFDDIRATLSKSREFKKFAQERTGLVWDSQTIEKQNIKERYGNVIDITLNLKKGQDLGFYGNYIDHLSYDFYSEASPTYNPVTKEFKIWFNAGIHYSHKSGGRNGVSEKNWSITYNLTTKKLEMEKWE